MDQKAKVVSTFITALQSGDMELAARTAAPAFVISGLFPRPLDRGELLGVQSELLAAMPDFSYNLSQLERTGPEVQALLQIAGTHTGELHLPLFGLSSLPATGLHIDLPQVHAVFLVEEEQVLAMEVEQIVGGGLAGLLQQVGAELPILPREASRPDPAYPEEQERPPNIDS